VPSPTPRRPHLGAVVGAPATRPAHRARARTVLLLVVPFLLLGTGTAVAYWAAAGSGSGTAAAGTAQPLSTVATSASVTSLLYPGGPAADVTLAVQNPNPYPVTITGVAADGPVTATGGIGTCTTHGVTLVAPTAGLPFTVSPSATATVTLASAAQMSTAAENGCQGATFTLPVSLTGASS
jgi:hypothetical protein